MASRYEKAKIIKDKTGKRKYSTVISTSPPPGPADTFILTTGIERMDKLAYDFYEDATLWWIIADANQLQKGTLYVEANTRLRIPPAANIQDLISKGNNER